MDITYLIIVLVTILLSMTLHEAMHAFMGHFLGDDTAKAQGRLTLNPLKHIDPVMTIALPVVLAIMGGPIFGGAKPVPFNPHRVRYGEWGAAMVALAGPLTNLLIAFVVFGVGVILGVISSDGIAMNLTGTIIWTAVQVNLGFFIFNILPIPPLDGSRVVYALAPEVVRRGMEQIERYGIMLVFALVLVGSSVLGQVMVGGMNAILQLFMTVFRV
jgi:Zn-dependent protease